MVNRKCSDMWLKSFGLKSQPSPEEYVRGKSCQSYLQFPVFMMQIQGITTGLIVILCVTLSHLFRKYDNESNLCYNNWHSVKKECNQPRRNTRADLKNKKNKIEITKWTQDIPVITSQVQIKSVESLKPKSSRKSRATLLQITITWVQSTSCSQIFTSSVITWAHGVITLKLQRSDCRRHTWSLWRLLEQTTTPRVVSTLQRQINI